MLASLHIENYRLFKQLDVPKLGRVNLITGKNNVGKTALLEAVRIYVNEGDASVIQNIIYERGGWKNRIIEKNYNTLFYQRAHQGNRIRINNLSFFIRDSRLQRSRNKEELRDIDANSLVNSLSHNAAGISIKSKTLKENVVLVTADIERTNSFLWEDIVLTAKEDTVLDILKIIEPNIAQIAVDSSGEDTKVRLKYARNPIALKDFGDGLQRLLTIAISLVSAENSYLLIDEFDIGLHHTVQEQLWDIIFKVSKELNVQVFATTHSKDCVEAFTHVALQYQEEESQYFRLQRKRTNDDIVTVEYSSEDLELALISNIETR